MSKTMRVPERLHDAVTAFAAALRTRPGDLMSVAFEEYLENHRAELMGVFDHAKTLIASRDYDGLVGLTSAVRSDWAMQAAKEAEADRGLQAREAHVSAAHHLHEDRHPISRDV